MENETKQGKCAWCKKPLEYLMSGSDGICDKCLLKYFPKEAKIILKKEK